MKAERTKFVGKEAELRDGFRTAKRIREPCEEARNPLGGPAEWELRTLLEWTEQGVVFFDPEGRLRVMNGRFVRMAGLEPEEASHIQTLEALIERMAALAEDPKALARRWRELVEREESGIREELYFAHPATRVLERTTCPVRDAAGKKVGRLELYRDLTAERVFQARLSQAEKLAALGRMVSGVAHELSNPLTSILGYAHRLLLRSDLAQNEGLQKIHQEASRASRMLRQLLPSSREVRPGRKPVSLNQIVLRALEFQRLGMSGENVRVEADLDPSAPLLLGNADQLQQVVTNLVDNAQHAIEHARGRGTVRVSTRRAGEGRLRLEIADDGPGIPPDLFARIFDPFFTTKPAGIGTGLGLSIVINIVREHGGQVQAANLPEGGALFTVDLPAVQEKPAPVRPPDREEGPVTAPESAAARRRKPVGVRVLVVEDEPTVARLIADVLREEGMEVEILFDGREALDRVAQRRYDLIVCDLKMPDPNGRHFYQELARTGNPLRDKFLFVTGDALAPQTVEFLERNRVPYVHKPFRVDELTHAVYRLLRGSGPLRAKHAAARNSS